MKKDKRILLISNMYPSKNEKHYGVFVQNTEELLRENDYIVNKVIIKKHKNKIIKLFSYMMFHLKVIIRGLFGHYDYLYVHFVSHSSLGAVIVKKLKRKVKLVLNCHGNDVIRDLEEEKKNVIRSHKYIKYADIVIVPSNYFKNEVIKEYNINKSKIFVYPSGGVNTNLFMKKDKLECKNKMNLSNNYKYIGFISRIEKNKGWDIFLKAIKELEKNNKIDNMRFLIVGSGEEKNKMNKMIEDLDISKYIDIHDMVYQKDLVSIYNAIDIFVLSSYRKESLGLVGLEAMACETLVITGNKYGPTDYIKDKINGFTFESGDYKDLVNKIIGIEKLSEKEINNIKKEARITALSYDINKTKDKILEVFK